MGSPNDYDHEHVRSCPEAVISHPGAVGRLIVSAANAVS